MNILSPPVTRRQLLIETGLLVLVSLACVGCSLYNIRHGGPIDTDNPSDILLYGAFLVLLGGSYLAGTGLRYAECKKRLFDQLPKK